MARLARVLQNLVGFAIVAGFGAYLWHSRAALSGVEASWPQLATIAAGVILTWLATSAQTFVLYRAEGLEIGFWENYLLTIMTSAVNYLPFRAGTLVRFRYLKAVHGLRYARAISVAGVRLTLLVLATAILGLAGVVGIALSGGTASLELASIFGALLLLACVPAFRRPPTTGGTGFVFRAWDDFSEGFAKIRSEPQVAVRVLALILCNLLLSAVRFHVSLAVVGIDAPLLTLLVLAPAATLASFVSLVPGGLGLREAVMGGVTLATGMAFDAGLFAGTVDHAVLLVLLLTAGSASLAFVWLRLHRSPEAGLSRQPREARIGDQQVDGVGGVATEAHVTSKEILGELRREK